MVGLINASNNCANRMGYHELTRVPTARRYPTPFQGHQEFLAQACSFNLVVYITFPDLHLGLAQSVLDQHCPGQRYLLVVHNPDQLNSKGKLPNRLHPCTGLRINSVPTGLVWTSHAGAQQDEHSACMTGRRCAACMQRRRL